MPREQNINQPTKGMNLDFHPMNLDGSKYYYKALNARQESIDGEQLALTNETGNSKCLQFKDGYVEMGTLSIPERNMTFYFLTNDTAKMSEIGVSDTSLLDPCNYEVVISASQDCLGYTSKTPIHKTSYKLTNETFEIYWTDGNTPMKWIDLYNIPTDGSGLDCNRIKIFPNFKTPCIHVDEVLDSGSLVAGAYQFFVAYANSKGEELSQYYAATNAVGIWENQTTNRFDFQTNKAIKIDISNIDTSYKYINIAVGKNINLTESFELAGFFPIQGNDTFTYLYTGNNKLVRPLSSADIFFRPSFYEKAETLVTQNNLLMFGGLKEEEIINYQKIVNKVTAYWQEWRVPENSNEGYNNGANTANLRSYLRDEGYALELAFVHRSGRISYGFHWPGPGVRPEDRELVNNKDSGNIVDNPCDEPQYLQKWQVYNTARVLSEEADYQFASDKKCYKGPYRYGEFASWESSLNYPDNQEIWGDLANTPIRHWKFPDCSVSPIHDNAGLERNYEHAIYPLGIKINIQSLVDAINASDLTTKQKEDIIGIKVLRANRAAHKSIIAKGLLYNVGQYTRDNETYLYPNYPYNDLNPDVFIASKQVDQKSGANPDLRLNGFVNTDVSKSRMTFFSPDTTFVRPAVSGYLNLETAEFGKAKAHLVEVQDNAKYTMGTKRGLRTALAIGLVSILGYEAGFPQATVSLKLENFLPTYNAMTDLLKKLIPYRQYGWQYNSVGNYSESIPIPNDGNKIRSIVSGKYLEPGMIAVENDIAPINNYQRESSVYIRLNDTLPFPHEVEGVPVDNSRFTKSSLKQNGGVVTDAQLAAYWNSLTGQQRADNFAREEEATQIAYLILVYGNEWDVMISETMRLQNDGTVTEDIVKRVRDYYLNYVLPPVVNDAKFVDISSYYGSIKRNVIDQYGQMYSYNTIDTGYCYFFNIADNSFNPPTIFGGDTFINRFGLKRKLPFFITNTVGEPDDSDVFYDQLGNIGYPIYYLSTGPREYTPSQKLMNKLDKAYERITDQSLSTGLGAAFSFGLSRFVPGITALVTLVEEIAERIGVKNNNLDDYKDRGFWEEGMMYLFAYGIPYFFVESDVNVNYRQAEDSLDKNFYPNVGTDIPDFWLQEKNVSINKDNFYYYNKSLSKQNLENAFSHLPIDFNPLRNANVVRPTRVIYSQPSNLEEKVNNWTIFKANNYKDLPLENGKIIDINAIESDKLLVRYENNSELHNVYVTFDTSNKIAIAGSGSLFSTPPIQFSKTDIGYTGTQHKNFNSTKYGHFWVDAKRGNVFLLQGNTPKDISQLGMKNWFKENLPFKILKYFKNVNIDNAFTGIGLASTWDNKYDRYFLTKKDYVPLNQSITYDETNQVFKLGETIISLTDKRYFCDASWTIAYTPQTESWVSYYSFIPDYYIEQNGYFQTGKNNSDSGSILWSHNLRDEERNYQSFYGVIEPFEIHTITKTSLDSDVLQSLQYRNEVYEYFTPYERVLKKNISFNNAVVYNVNQTSGNLELVLDNKEDMRSGLFAKVNNDSVEVSLSEANQVYRFNKFYNLVKDNNNVPIVKFDCANTIETINPLSINYNKYNNIIKERLKSDWFKVKLSNTIHTAYKFIFKYLIDKSIKSLR